MLLKFVFLLLFYNHIESAQANSVVIKNNGPAIRGSNVTFTATILTNDTQDQWKFTFYSNDEPRHYKEIISKGRTVQYTAAFSRDKYDAGFYDMHVTVKKSSDGIFWWDFGENHTIFILTDLFNGELKLYRNGTVISNGMVTANEPVTHFVKVPNRELISTTNNSNIMFVFWIVNCSIEHVTSINYLTWPYKTPGNYDLQVLVAYQEPTLPSLSTFNTKNALNNTRRKRVTNTFERLLDYQCMDIAVDFTYGLYKTTIHVIDPVTRLEEPLPYPKPRTFDESGTTTLITGSPTTATPSTERALLNPLSMVFNSLNAKFSTPHNFKIKLLLQGLYSIKYKEIQQN